MTDESPPPPAAAGPDKVADTPANELRAVPDPVVADAGAELDAIEEALAAVSRALERLESGGERTCEVCGAPLGDDVVSGAPSANRCAAHA